MPPEGPWELQGIELLSQKELYHQVLLLLHLLPQDLLLLQVRPPHSPLRPRHPWVVAGLCLPCPLPGSPEATETPFSPALPVFLLLLSGGAGPSHPVRAPGCRGGRQSH